jgi:ERCC4-type nuclease
MNPLHDIFHKRKSKSKKEFVKPKIIVDYREKSSLVPSELVSLGFEVEFKELKVADYLVKETAIERKTVSDFISSMMNRRLLRQLEELQQYKNRLLVIEGIAEQDLYNDKDTNGVSSNAIRGFLLSILLKHKVPIMFTKDYRDTAKFIAVLSKKQDKEVSLNAKKKSLNKKEQLQFIIEGFPGIGPTTAKKLLEEFKSIRGIINASEEDLTNAIGKKGEIVKRLVEEGY